jgi:D-amino-acid dehydrogenase
VVIIGAGIVGLACAERLLAHGMKVTVVDRAPHGDKCSWGNAGGIAVTEILPAAIPGLIWKIPGWLLDPVGPLFINFAHALRMLPWLAAFLRSGRPEQIKEIAAALTALNALVYDDLVPLIDRIGLACDLNRVGAITVYSDRRACEKDAAEWDLRREHGIAWSLLSASQLREMEPELSDRFKAGVLTPAWSHVADPKRIVCRLLRHVTQQGATILADEAVGFETGGDELAAVQLSGQGRLAADAVVIAAGAWSAGLAARLGERVLLESERGYNTTVDSDGIAIGHEIIFAEQKFVITPLERRLRVGGAAEFTGLTARPNFARSQALMLLARRAVPKLAARLGSEWMGQQPTTPDNLPVIGRATRIRNAIYAFGHGHLGLTQAASTARLVAELLRFAPTSIDLRPFAASRFT